MDLKSSKKRIEITDAQEKMRGSTHIACALVLVFLSSGFGFDANTFGLSSISRIVGVFVPLLFVGDDLGFP